MSGSMPAISVILCTYNRKAFLPRSVESILSQSFERFELILVNNGCTDGSEELCREYAKKDSRVRLITIEENRGAPVGRNAGLEAASCPFVTFVDDDDYCEPQMLEFLWNLSQEHRADISICGSWNDFDGRLEPYFIFDELLILNKVQGLEELLKREKYNVAPPTKLFRKSLFEGIRFKENVLVDDIHITYRLFANANVVAAWGKPLYRFRKHAGNMTGFIQTNRLTLELLEEYLCAYRERTEYLSEKVPEIAARAKFSEWSFMIAMCHRIRTYGVVSCSALYDEMIAYIQRHMEEWIDSPFITERDKTLLRSLPELSTP